MLQYQIRRGKLASLSYRVGDVSYDLNYLKNTSAWNMLSTLILAGDVDGATELYKLGFSIAACDNWVRMSSGHWTVQYADMSCMSARLVQRRSFSYMRTMIAAFPRTLS
jgi:hypothetical protein